MPPATRGQGKPQRARESSQPHLPNRNTATPPQRSGTSTPENSATTRNVSSTIIPSEVKEYIHSRWQKYCDDARAQEKSGSQDIVILGVGGVQQGWNTIGGKPASKGANPLGAQNRPLTSKGTPFLHALKTAIDEAANPQKGG